MAKRKQTFAEGAFVLTLALLVAKIVGAVYRIALNNIIDTDGVGYYTFAYNLYNTVYAIAVTGFPTAVSKIVAGFSAEGRYKDVRRTVAVSTTFFAAVGIVSSLVVIAMAKPYCDLNENPRALYSVLAFAPSLVFSCLMSTHRGYYQGMSNMTPTAISQVIEVFAKAGAGFAGAWFARAHFAAEYAASGTVFGAVQLSEEAATATVCAMSSAGAMLGVTASTLVGWVYFVIIRHRNGDGIRKAQINASPEPYTQRDILKRILAVGIPIALSSVTVSLTGLIDNISVLDRLRHCLETDAAAVFASHGGLLEQAGRSIADLPNYLYGAYGIGSPLFSLVPTITGAFGMSALPHIASAWQGGDLPLVKKNIESAIKMTMLVACPAGFGISFLAGPIDRLLFRKDPIGTEINVPILTVLGVAAIFVCLSGLLNAALQAVGRVDIPVKLMLLGGAVKLACNYLLVAIPEYNIKGAPFGNLACYFVISILALVILLRIVKVRLSVVSNLLKPLFAGLCTGVAGLLGYNLTLRVLRGRTTVATFAGIALAVAVYVAMIGILRLLSEEDVLALPGGTKMKRILEKLHILR